MIIVTHIIFYYKLFLCFYLCLSVLIRGFLYSFAPIIRSYYKLFLYFNLCLSLMFDSLSSSFTSISFLITSFFYFNLCLSLMFYSSSSSSTSMPFLTKYNTHIGRHFRKQIYILVVNLNLTI